MVKDNDIYNDVITEEMFLDTLLNKYINIFLISGIKLTGELVAHDVDMNCIIIERENSKLLIYKSAIATISPENRQKRRIV